MPPPTTANAVATLARRRQHRPSCSTTTSDSFDHADVGRRCRRQSTLVSLTVPGLPFAPPRVLHYVVDHTHSNSHTVWVGMGKPLMPSADQWAPLRDASELCYYATTASGGTRGRRCSRRTLTACR